MNEKLGQGPLRPDLHLLQRHVLPDAHHRHARPSRGASPTRPSTPTSRARRHRDEPVHDRSAPSCWGCRRSSSRTTSSQPVPAGPGPRTTRGTPTRWSGPPRRRRRTATSRRIPTVYHRPYEYSVPGVRRGLPAADRAHALGDRPRPGDGLNLRGEDGSAGPPTDRARQELLRPEITTFPPDDRRSCASAPTCDHDPPSCFPERFPSPPGVSPWPALDGLPGGGLHASPALCRGLGDDLPRGAWPCPTGRRRSASTCSFTTSGTLPSASRSSTLTGSTGRRWAWPRSG